MQAPECPLGSAGRSGLADNSGGTTGALLFSCSCFHFVSPYVFCSRAKGRKHCVSRGKKEAGGWMSRIPRGPESALVGRGSCRVSIAQQCTFQCDSVRRGVRASGSTQVRTGKSGSFSMLHHPLGYAFANPSLNLILLINQCPNMFLLSYKNWKLKSFDFHIAYMILQHYGQ